MIPPPPRSTLFPYTTLFRSQNLPGGTDFRELLRTGKSALRPRGCKRMNVLDRFSLRDKVVILTGGAGLYGRSEEHTSELQSRRDLVCRLLLEKTKDRCPPPH